MPAIRLANVTKRYGDVVAVDDLDLTVEAGEIYGFLGPNGAGKSTTINMLLDFVRPTDGRIEVLGESVAEAGAPLRERIGVLPEGFDVYSRLSGRKHVAFAIESKDADDDPDAILERVGLAEAADRPAGGYSKGMRQRLALGMALVGDPELLILDEPSSGLDPGGAKEMREIVTSEADRGATVFFSSHILGQVEAICDHVGILQKGELVAEDSMEALRATVEHGERLVVHVDRVDGEAIAAIEALSGVETVIVGSADGDATLVDDDDDSVLVGGDSGAAGDGLDAPRGDPDGESETITVGCAASAKAEIITTLASAGIEIRDFETESISLESLFLSFTDEEPAVADDGGDDGQIDGGRDGGATDEAEANR